MCLIVATAAGKKGSTPCGNELKAIEMDLKAGASGDVAARAVAAVKGPCSNPSPRHAARLQKISEKLKAHARAEAIGEPSRANDGALQTHMPMPVRMAIGPSGEETELTLAVPTEAAKPMAIANPQQLMSHVAHVWETIVAPHQTGLVDAKAPNPGSELSAPEAWHHYQAA
jgi:hypothetical protein